MAINKFIYPIDISGVRASNRIEETHSIGTENYRAVALYHGPFFTDNLEVREVGTNRRLERGEDYEVTFFYQELTMLTAGKEIGGVIVVHNTEIKSEIVVNANIFGGPFVTHAPLIAKAIEQLQLDDRDVFWHNVLQKPENYQALPHLNDIGDVFGFEFIIDQMAAIKDAILVGNNSMLEDLKESIDSLKQQLEAKIQEHLDDEDNPHSTDSDKVNAYTKEYINTMKNNIDSTFADLEPRLDDFDERITNVAAQYNALGQTVGSLQDRQGDLEATYQQLHRLIADVNESIRLVNVEIDRIDNELAALRAADVALQKAVDDVEKLINDLAVDVGDIETELVGIKAKNNEQDSALATLKSRVDGHDTEIAGIKTKNSQQDSSISSLSNRMTTAERDIGNIETKNSQQDSSINSLNSSVSTINGQISAIITKNSQQDTAINTAQGRADYAVSLANSKLSDAPKDNKIYGRQNGAWVETSDADVIQDILDRLDDLEAEVRKLVRTMENVTSETQTTIESYFTQEEIRNKDCTLIVKGCKLGGGDRTYGSLHTKLGTWYKLTVVVTGGSQIIGKGGNGEAVSGGCGAGQARSDGGHAITFPANTNTYVQIESGCTVIGGGAGGQSGWRVNCGYSNSGTGGAGGGGAGFPPGKGGPNGNQGSSCFCSTANKGADGTETTGGAGGAKTGYEGGDVSSQAGSNGGDLGQKASRPDGRYPIGAHGNAGSAVVGAKQVTNV